MEQPTQTFILCHSGGNSCYSCKGAIAFAIAICYCLRYPQAGRGTLHLAVVLFCLSSWQLHPPHVQTRFKKKEMLHKFILGPQGALMYTGGDFRQRLQVLWLSSVCGVNSALPGFVDKVGIQGRVLMQEQRSRLQGQCDKPDSKGRQREQPVDKDKRVTFSKCHLTASRLSVTVPVDFGPDLVTESTALSSALGLPVRLAGRAKWILGCQQSGWEVDGSNSAVCQIPLLRGTAPCLLRGPLLSSRALSLDANFGLRARVQIPL